MLAPILPAAALAREQAVDRLRGFPGVQTVLVNHAGELVAVRGNPERPHNIKSLSKSLLSAAAGIALADRTFGGLDQPGGCVAGDFEYNTDPRVRAGEQLLAPD